jgi:hypothetical protein
MGSLRIGGAGESILIDASDFGAYAQINTVSSNAHPLKKPAADLSPP